jgi:D-hydroxyproline dehydrogenase
MQQKAAVVIGGGLIGTCCAIELQRRGIDTLIVDPAAEMRPASWGNAGHIAVEQVEPLASPTMLRNFWRQLYWRGGPVSLPPRQIGAWLPFALRFVAATRRFPAGKAALSALVAGALPAWRALLADADAADLLIEEGHYLVWESEAAAARSHVFWAKADTGEVSLREASADELARIRHGLAGGLRFCGSGHIADPGALANALERRFESLGGRRLRATAKLVPGSDRVAVNAGDTLMDPDIVLVAAGVASKKLMAAAGHEVPLIAERGYHIQLEAPDWPADLPPVVFEERAMIATRFSSGLRLAGFFEFAAPDAPADPRKWRRLRAHARALGLPLEGEVTEWTGARPTLPDYLPAIGRSRRASNLFYAFGHQHLGLTLAAVTGRAVGALAVGERPDIGLAPFGIERFGRKA